VGKSSKTTAETADEIAADKKFEQVLKEWGRSEEDIIRDLKRQALAELADPAFEVRKPIPLFKGGHR
jgi:hypothetical protein